MLNFTKRNLDELFTNEKLPDYSVIVTELRNEFGDISSEDDLNEVLNACSNLMTASYVNHYCEKAGNLIVCFLNYDTSVFSVRAFVGSLRQTMYSISQKNRSFVCYSEGIQDRKTLFDESIFLVNGVKYGFLLGSNRPYTGELLHRLEASHAVFDPKTSLLLFEELTEKNYDAAIDRLKQSENTFLNLLTDGEPYPFPELLNFISEIFSTIKLFFHKQNYHLSFMEENIFILLFKSNGCAGLLRLFGDSVTKYRDNFSRVSSSEREKKNMQDILTHISENLKTATLSETAAHFDLTDAYLCRLFKKNMGINFTEYIKNKKMETALKLLQSNEKITVSAVSQAIGMKSQSHFQNVFKNEFGITPEVYRRNYRLNKPN